MGPLAHPWARPGLLGRTETALRENCAASKLRCEETALRANGSAGARSVKDTILSAQKAPAGRLSGSKYNSSTLRAYPPTRLHAAQFLRSAAHAQRNFLAAQFLLFLANRGGPRGGPRAPNKRPRARGPKGPKGPSGPLGQGALRAPWAPSGPIGDRLYATKIILNRINNTQRK